MIFESFSDEDTKKIAKDIAINSKKGDIFTLDGEIGTGKTVFSKGFCDGLGVKDIITSPTFNIMNIYKGKFTLYHFDVYRINNISEMFEIGYEDFFYGGGICLIEWGELIEEILPKYTKKIYINKDLRKDENFRTIEVKT